MGIRIIARIRGNRFAFLKGGLMNFIEINRQFLALHKKKYNIIDIKEFDFLPQLSNILICFVVKTEKEKHMFLNNSYKTCCQDYLNFVKKNNDCSSLKYEFMLLSEEEVKKKYGGNYYYAMH